MAADSRVLRVGGQVQLVSRSPSSASMSDSLVRLTRSVRLKTLMPLMGGAESGSTPHSWRCRREGADDAGIVRHMTRLLSTAGATVTSWPRFVRQRWLPLTRSKL